MKTTIETTNTFLSGDILNAVDNAMNKTNIPDFINVLIEEIPSCEIIQAGSHIAIHKNDVRVAIITNY